MKQNELLKWGLYGKIGDEREQLVANYFKKQGFIVKKAFFLDDVNRQIDLIVQKGNSNARYVQVKGFHHDFKNESFDKLISASEEDGAIPIVARVNKKNRIYFWNPLKKRG